MGDCRLASKPKRLKLYKNPPSHRVIRPKGSQIRKQKQIITLIICVVKYTFIIIH